MAHIVTCCCKDWTGGNNGKEMNSSFLSSFVATHLTWYFLPRYYVIHSVFTIWNILFHFLVYAITSLKPFFPVHKWFAISVGSSSYFQKKWTALGLFRNSRLNWNKGENILIGEERMFPVWLSLLWSLLLILLYLLSLVSFFIESCLPKNIMINSLFLFLVLLQYLMWLGQPQGWSIRDKWAALLQILSL